MGKKVGAVIVAAGSSSRMNGIDKLDIPLQGGTVLTCSVGCFANSEDIAEVVVAVRPEQLPQRREQVAAMGFRAPVAVTMGGQSRFLSVKNGVGVLSPDIDYVAIHDAARPFVSSVLVGRVIEAARRHGAAAPGIPVSDTVKTVDKDGFVTSTLRRPPLRAMATPQVFSLPLYRAAAEAYPEEEALDDCEVVERFGHPVKVVEGDPGNIKITGRADLLHPGFGGGFGMRIGHGYDAHRLAAGRRLVLGGVEIPHSRGLDGHSDADVLAHAVIDALLGAAAMGDIGMLFPDSDPRFLGADSMSLLRETGRLLAEAGYSAVNVDATVVAEQPKLATYREKMRSNIAAALEISVLRVSVKATTEERMGFTGALCGIAAHAVVSVVKR